MPSIPFLGRAFFPLCAILLAGCMIGTVTDRDVSRDEHFLVGYRPGQIYRLTQPANVLQLDGNYCLWPPGAMPQRSKPAGIIPKGSRIKIISLRHQVFAAPVQWETRVEAKAQMVDGPERVVSLQAVSDVRWINGDHGMKTPVLLPDPKWMELVLTREPHGI